LQDASAAAMHAPHAHARQPAHIYAASTGPTPLPGSQGLLQRLHCSGHVRHRRGRRRVP
jgi:hypothetical protein